MKNEVIKAHRALELAARDWATDDRSKDQELADEWGVTAAKISEMRRTDAYRQAVMDLQDRAITYVGQQIGDIQSTAISYLQDLIPKLAKAANDILVPPEGATDRWVPSTGAINAATNVMKTLYDFSGLKDGNQAMPTSNRPSQQVLPNLRIATSNTEIVREMRVRVTHSYESPSLDNGAVIDLVQDE